MDISTLKQLGFSDKTASVYLALLQLGPSSVRKLAEAVELNRGTTYDALKWLQDVGVVTFYKTDTKQTFVAEHPGKLRELLKQRERELSTVSTELDRMVPELMALHHTGGGRPMARYVSKSELPVLLQDVLETAEASEEKTYRIYSAEGIREYLYNDFSTFSDVRIAKGIEVQVIAIGKGGELRGLDKRKWLKAEVNSPTYIIIYPGKVASISLDAKGEPVGVIIENRGVYETERAVFDALWQTL
jgi:sugar-specific transcriptional regulator TrmB